MKKTVLGWLLFGAFVGGPLTIAFLTSDDGDSSLLREIRDVKWQLQEMEHRNNFHQREAEHREKLRRMGLDF